MTAYEMRISDWSSDVCSSDLVLRAESTKPVRDEILRRPVGFSHQINGALEPHVVWLTETVTEDLTRVTGDLHRLVGVIVQHDRKSVVEGKSVSVRVELGGRGIIKTKKIKSSIDDHSTE